MCPVQIYVPLPGLGWSGEWVGWCHKRTEYLQTRHFFQITYICTWNLNVQLIKCLWKMIQGGWFQNLLVDRGSRLFQEFLSRNLGQLENPGSGPGVLGFSGEIHVN